MKDLNKKIAAAIELAQKLHEESYVKQYDSGGEWIAGEYTIEWECCWQRACETQDLPDDLWYILSLANHWYNDIQLWAEEILAGRPWRTQSCEDEDDKAPQHNLFRSDWPI